MIALRAVSVTARRQAVGRPREAIRRMHAAASAISPVDELQMLLQWRSLASPLKVGVCVRVCVCVCVCARVCVRFE